MGKSSGKFVGAYLDEPTLKLYRVIGSLFTLLSTTEAKSVTLRLALMEGLAAVERGELDLKTADYTARSKEAYVGFNIDVNEFNTLKQLQADQGLVGLDRVMPVLIRHGFKILTRDLTAVQG